MSEVTELAPRRRTATLEDLAARAADLAADVAALAARVDAPVGPARSDVLAIPFYFTTDPSRAAITRKVFEHYRRCAERFGLQVVGLGSEGTVSRDLWCEFFPEVNYREYPQPWTGSASGAGSAMLRAKFDETARAARPFDPDRVFIVGSDDILTEGFFAAALESPADLIGVGKGPADAVRIVRPARRRVHLWDGHYQWAPDVQFCGGGVAISRQLMDAWNFAPFSEPGDEVGIERRARADGASIEAICAGPTTFRFWAIKGESAVLNTWRQVDRNKPATAPWSMFAEFLELWGQL